MKLNFIYPIKTTGLPKVVEISMKMGVKAFLSKAPFLKDKAKPSLNKLRIEAEEGLPVRVSYSPLTGLIKVNPEMNKIRDNRKGIVPNLLLALGMGYYDFGLSKSDQLYWKNLTRREKVDLTLLKRSSFSVSQVGKPRILFAIELFKHTIFQTPSVLLETFFDVGSPELIELSSTRFRGLGLTRGERKEQLETSSSLVDRKTVSLEDALDIAGITGLTDDMREAGYRTELDYDQSGIMEFKAYSGSRVVLQMKRYFFDDIIKNEYFTLSEDLQRQGLGMKAFATQLTSAIKHGVEKIQLVAEREDDSGLFGYNVWWRFGFDGHLDSGRYGSSLEAKAWWKQAVVEKILGASDMTSQKMFYGMVKRLKRKTEEGSFSNSAFQYFMDVTLDGEYNKVKDFQIPSRKDFLALVDFFNKVSPESPFLKEEDLSYKFQRIQRLMELEGFEDWWKQYGDKWNASLDLSDGVESPSVGLVRNYIRGRS